jgi:hypothetical protein
MDEIVKGIFTAPLATVFVIAGIIFLLVAVIGNISGKIEPDAKGRVTSGILGLVFVIVGLSIHFAQEATDSRDFPARIPEPKESDQVAGTPQKPPAKEQFPAVTSTKEKEPNDLTRSATPIALGAIIQGRIATGQDRDMFTFHTTDQPVSKIRVILRKTSVKGFAATVTVYDLVERTIASSTAVGDTPVSLGFEGTPNSDYYVSVKPFLREGRGDYELAVRVEEQGFQGATWPRWASMRATETCGCLGSGSLCGAVPGGPTARPRSRWRCARRRASAPAG